jgi:hypothetical protein
MPEDESRIESVQCETGGFGGRFSSTALEVGENRTAIHCRSRKRESVQSRSKARGFVSGKPARPRQGRGQRNRR